MEVKLLYFYNHHNEWHCDIIDHSYDLNETKQTVSVMRVKPEGRRPDFLHLFDEYNQRNPSETHRPVCMINQYGLLCLISRNGKVLPLDEENSTTVENQFKTHLTVPKLKAVKEFLE